jgi:hypothetical protein
MHVAGNVEVKVPRRWHWKDLAVCVSLWLTYFTCSAAYSVIGPFFPLEVGETKGAVIIIMSSA